MFRTQVHLISGTSPAAASTAVIGTTRGLDAYDSFQIFAHLIGGTGTAGDIAWLQYRMADDVDVWVDWIRFGAISATTTYKWLVSPTSTNTIVATGSGTEASPGTVTIGAGVVGGGHPGDCVRLVYTAGASTSAGGAQKVYIKGIRRRY